MALTNEHKAFIERIGRLAAADMQKSGVLASLTIAQAILESRSEEHTSELQSPS